MRIIVDVADNTELMSEEQIRKHIIYLRGKIRDIETCIIELE